MASGHRSSSKGDVDKNLGKNRLHEGNLIPTNLRLASSNVVGRTPIAVPHKGG